MHCFFGSSARKNNGKRPPENDRADNIQYFERFSFVEWMKAMLIVDPSKSYKIPPTLKVPISRANDVASMFFGTIFVYITVIGSMTKVWSRTSSKVSRNIIREVSGMLSLVLT